MKNSEKNMYRRLLNKYGIREQLLVLQEEFGELIKSCSKYLRGDYSDYTTQRDMVKYELADLQILSEQVQTYVEISDSELEKFKEYKLARIHQQHL